MIEHLIASPTERRQTVLPTSTHPSALLIIITTGGAAGLGLAVWLSSFIH